MTQKPVLRAEVYARALRASQNVLTSESGGRATQWAIELSFHLESNVALATHNRFSSGLDPLLELNHRLVFRSLPRRVWERAHNKGVPGHLISSEEGYRGQLVLLIPRRLGGV